jgi:acetyl esterase/lipase
MSMKPTTLSARARRAALAGLLRIACRDTLRRLARLAVALALVTAAAGLAGALEGGAGDEEEAPAPPGALEAAPLEGIDIRRDLPYVSTPSGDARLQSLDLYLPAGAGGPAPSGGSAPPGAPDAPPASGSGPRAGALRPIAVFVHGGAWAIGDKRRVGEKARAFLEAGFLFASVNYRLSPAVRHPAHVEDVAAAIGWLARSAPGWGGDPSRFVLVGHSAGAHLVALVATDARRLAASGVSLTAIRGVVPLDGAGYDIPAQVERNPLVRRMFERAFGPEGEGWRDASPIAHVVEGKGIPPFLLVHAGRRAASEAQAAALAARLGEAGVEARLHHEPEKNHGSVNRDVGVEGDPLTDAVIGFARRVAGLAPRAAVGPRPF